MPGLPAWTQRTGKLIAAASRLRFRAFALMLLAWLTSILKTGVSLRSRRCQGRLRNLCRDAGHTPEVLGAVIDLPLDQACAREMQICRLQGQHKLVISLGETAVAMGLDHPRIHNNLTRSRNLLKREARLEKIQRLLQGKRSSRDRAEALLVEGLLDDPGTSSYRVMLEKRLRDRFRRAKGDPFRLELLDVRVGHEINRRQIELLALRQSSAEG